jgi:hypothetical protein
MRVLVAGRLDLTTGFKFDDKWNDAPRLYAQYSLPTGKTTKDHDPAPAPCPAADLRQRVTELRLGTETVTLARVPGGTAAAWH